MSDNWQITSTQFFAEDLEGLDAEDLAELGEGYKGYDGLDFLWTVQRVADRIFNIHMARDVRGTFIFSLTCNADGEIDGAIVSIDIPGEWSLYLNESLEEKRLTDDRSAMDTQGLLAIKDALMFSYERIRKYATTKGLI